MAHMRDIKQAAAARRKEALALWKENRELTMAELGALFGGITGERFGQILKRAKEMVAKDATKA